MSSEKESGFFHTYWEEGLSSYEKFFAQYNGETAVGEATIGYSAFPEVPRRMHSVLPDGKLVFMAHDPRARGVPRVWWKRLEQLVGRSLREWPMPKPVSP